MRGQDHADPGAPGSDNNSCHGRPRQPVLANCRLVQDQDRRAMGDGACQGQTPLFAAGEVVWVRAGQGRQAQYLEQAIGPSLCSIVVQAQQPTGREHVVADGAGDNCELSLLRHPPEPGRQDARGPAVDDPGGAHAHGEGWARAHGHGCARAPADQQRVPGTHQSLRGRVDTSQQRRQGRLAGATGADDCDALACADCRADIQQGLHRGCRPVRGHDRHAGPAQDGDRLCRHQHPARRSAMGRWGTQHWGTQRVGHIQWTGSGDPGHPDPLGR